MSLSKFFRGLIAITIAFSVAFITLSQPVLAASNVSSNSDSVTQINVGQGDGSTFVFNNDPVGLPSNSIIDDFAGEIVNVAKGIAATTILCYSLDGIATLLFPPAAGALPMCSALPTLAGGTLATKTTDAVLKAL